MGMDSISKAEVITEIFHGAEAVGIPYCILRNYSDLPNSTLGGDIDLLCPSSMGAKWMEHLQFVASFFNLEMGVIQIHYHGIRYCLFSVKNPFFLKLDVHYGEYWRGVQFINAAQLLDSAVYYNGYRVLSRGHEAVLSLLAPLITGGKVRSKYEDVIVNSVSQNRDEFTEILQGIVGLSTASKIAHLIIRGRYHEVSTLTTRVRISLWLRMLFRSRGRDLFSVYKYLVYEFQRRINLLGYLIVISGSDEDSEIFLNLFKEKSEKDFPGVVNIELGEISYKSVLPVKVVLSRLLQSYNIVFCSSRYFGNGIMANDKRHFRKQKKITLRHGIVIMNYSKFSLDEAVNELYSEVLSCYAENYCKVVAAKVSK